MTGIRHRPATPDDAAALANLGRRTFVETFGPLYSPDNLAAFLRSHTETGWREELSDRRFAVRLAEADGEPAAFAKLGPPTLPFEPRGRSIELRQFYVLRPWHGTGLAHDLMRWAIEEARARAASGLYLSVFVDNHRARRFYEGYGFAFVGTYAFMVGDHADEDHVMRLGLEEG